MSKTWIVPARPESMEIAIDSFRRIGLTAWYKSYNFEVGDIVYLYVSSPIKEVQYKCRVTDTNYYLPEDSDDDRNKSRIKDSFFKEGPFVEFTELFEFDSDGQTSYNAFKAVGVTSQFQCAVKIDGVVADYLEKVENDQKNLRAATDADILVLPIDELRQRAIRNSSVEVATTRELVTQYYRNRYVALYAKRRANGICELCENKAPFLDKDDQPYLESHHIVWLSEGGSDTIDNTVALCPNCHRKMHIVNDENDVAKLKEKARCK